MNLDTVNRSLTTTKYYNKYTTFSCKLSPELIIANIGTVLDNFPTKVVYWSGTSGIRGLVVESPDYATHCEFKIQLYLTSDPEKILVEVSRCQTDVIDFHKFYKLMLNGLCDLIDIDAQYRTDNKIGTVYYPGNVRLDDEFIDITTNIIESNNFKLICQILSIICSATFAPEALMGSENPEKLYHVIVKCLIHNQNKMIQRLAVTVLCNLSEVCGFREHVIDDAELLKYFFTVLEFPTLPQNLYHRETVHQICKILTAVADSPRGKLRLNEMGFVKCMGVHIRNGDLKNLSSQAKDLSDKLID